MTFLQEPLDEILENYHRPEDFYGPSGIMKQLAKALVERIMKAELTGEGDWHRWGKMAPELKSSPKKGRALENA